MSLIKVSDNNEVRVIQFNQNCEHNPISNDFQEELINSIKDANNSSEIQAIVFTGGENRSFSAGGDFNEVKNIKTTSDVENWINGIINLYQCVLSIDKPTVANINGYAIGMGFQLAMLFDWRIAADDAQFSMPELQHGIGCTLGAAILRHVSNTNIMKKLVFGCMKVNGKEAEKLHLVDEALPSAQTHARALKIASQLAAYPKAAFQNTKKAMVSELVNVLENVRKSSIAVHSAAFSEREMHKHFKQILGDKYEKATQ